jgi:predicted chitinase/LAS superfamily LD-carboxypeptidase LdcB
MIDDKDLKKSIQTKFYLGQSSKDEVVLTKQTISTLSKGLNSLQNSFNQLKAYNSNITKINRAVIAAKVSGKKESALERTNVAPVDSSADQITSLFPKLTKALEDLKTSLTDLELGESSGLSLLGNVSGGGSGRLLGGLAAGAGAIGLGYAAFSSDEAQAAEPKPAPPEPEKASSVAKQTEQNASERKAQNEKSDSKRAQKDASQEQQSEKLSQTVSKTSSLQASVTRQAAPPAANDWSSKLSNYIGQSVKTVDSRVASFQPGGGGGGYSDSSYGDEGVGVNPPKSGMAGLVYQTGKQLGYDDYMSVAFVALAEKESGLKPQAENMNYSAARIKQVWPNDPGAMQYAGNPQGLANYKYGSKFGNKGGNDGWNYRGKGLNQLTFRANYERIGRKIGYDLVKDPDALVNKPDIAVKAFYGYYDGHPVMKGRKSAKSQSEANRIVTDATGGKTGFSTNSSFGAENLAKVQGFASKYSAGGLAATDTSAAAMSSGRPGPSLGPVQRSGETVQGMGFETAQAATRQMGIRGSNGNLDSGQLKAIGVGSLKAAPPAASAIMALRAAAAREGINVGVTDAYRDYNTQVRLKAQKGKMAATPGRSNHGWGLAFDLSDAGKGIQKNSMMYRWMKANSERFGIYGPLAKPYEIWHWEYRGGGSASPATIPVTPQAQQVGAPQMRSPSGGIINNVAASQPKEHCACDEPTIIAVPTGGGAPSPIDYLKGQKPAQAARKYNVDTSQDYRVYFNAA